MDTDAAAARATRADATVARLVSGPTMRQIVGHLATIDDTQFRRAQAICLSMGEGMVRPLAEALAVEERTRTRERLTAILLGFGAIGRREVEQLKSSANPAVRRTAIYLLREFGGSEALPELTELLDDAEPGVQREAVRAILTIGTDRGYEVLQQALVSGTPRSREAIMLALGSNRDERCAPLLVYILEHVPHKGELGWIYARALDLLGQLRDPESVPALRAAPTIHPDRAPRRTAALRSAAAAALARIASPEALEVLAVAAREGSRGVRAAAAGHLEMTGRGRGQGGR
jgi:HEAT repeat protein